MRASLKSTTTPSTLSCDTLVIPLYKDKKLSPASQEVDKASGKSISALLKGEDFSANLGEILTLPIVSGLSAKRIVLWGLGEKDKINRQLWSKACAALSSNTLNLKGSHCAIISDIKTNKSVPFNWALQQIALYFTRNSYLYCTTKASKKSDLSQLKKISVLNAENNKANQQSLKQGLAIGQGINIARELGNLPGNICTPKYLSGQARQLGRKYAAISTTVLGEKQMKELGMDSLLSVGNGSDQESQFMIMKYQGGKKSQQPQVIVGKGITFDSGGISLKPGAKMDEMKFDMCGAATVIGTVSAIAEMKLPINVIGVIASAENMPSGRATKPGDVINSMAGKTIEVLNTDAEGRLVLCDALHYVKRFKPAATIDIATLTGACIVALGHHATALLSTDDSLADELFSAGIDSTDRAWRLPIWDEFQKQIQSPFADLANLGGPAGGTITAACFLSHFTEGYRWAHLDIAGTAWNQAGAKGASGRPVAMLCQYLMAQAGKAAV